MSSRRRGAAGDPFGAGEDLSLHDVDNALFGGIQHADRLRTVVRPVEIAEIAIDQAIQVRLEGLNDEQVRAWAEAMEQGTEFPPIILFEGEDGVKWMGDGFHRLEAARLAGLAVIRAEIRPGGYAAAYSYAEEANLKHGQRLSRESLKAVLWRRLARDHEWARLSEREVARQLGVSHPTIAAWKKEYFQSTGKSFPVREKRESADGRILAVSGIGKANRRRAKKPARLSESQVQQRVIAALHRAAEGLADLGSLDHAESLREYAADLAAGWKLKG